MLQGQRGRAIGLIPVGGSQVQLHDDVGLDPLKLAEQELPEQGVVAIPPAPAVQRDEEQARRLQVAQLRLTRPTRSRSRRTAERTVGRAPRYAAGTAEHLSGSCDQQLAVQVVGDVAIVTGDRQPVAVTVAGDHRGQVQADGPSFGSRGDGCGLLVGEVHVGRGEDLLRARRVEGQVGGGDLHRVARGPQSWQVGLLGTAHRDQLRTLRNPRDHHAEHIVTGRGVKFVKIVEHQHERDRAGSKRRGEARRGAAQRRYAKTAHVSDQICVARDPRVRRRQHSQQCRRIIVQPVQRHPADTSILQFGPLCQQGRLAVTRRRRDPDHPAVAGPSRLDQVGVTHRTRPALRHRQLRFEQHRLKFGGRRPCTA